jgi:hypothetical protein
VDEAGRHRVGAAHHLVEFRFGNLFHGKVAERIFPVLLQPVPPVGQDGAEGAAAGTITDEAFFVAQFLVVGIDGNGRQGTPTMDQD